jgi:hypothetical protein
VAFENSWLIHMGRGDVISTFFYKRLIEQCGAGCLPVSKARIMTLTYKLCPTAQGDSPQHEVYEKCRDKKAIQTDNHALPDTLPHPPFGL